MNSSNKSNYALYEIVCEDDDSMNVENVSQHISKYYYNSLKSEIKDGLIYIYPTHDNKLYFASSKKSDVLEKLPKQIELDNGKLVLKMIKLKSQGFTSRALYDLNTRLQPPMIYKLPRFLLSGYGIAGKSIQDNHIVYCDLYQKKLVDFTITKLGFDCVEDKDKNNSEPKTSIQSQGNDFDTMDVEIVELSGPKSDERIQKSILNTENKPILKSILKKPKLFSEKNYDFQDSIEMDPYEQFAESSRKDLQLKENLMEQEEEDSSEKSEVEEGMDTNIGPHQEDRLANLMNEVVNKQRLKNSILKKLKKQKIESNSDIQIAEIRDETENKSKNMDVITISLDLQNEKKIEKEKNLIESSDRSLSTDSKSQKQPINSKDLDESNTYSLRGRSIIKNLESPKSAKKTKSSEDDYVSSKQVETSLLFKDYESPEKFRNKLKDSGSGKKSRSREDSEDIHFYSLPEHSKLRDSKSSKLEENHSHSLPSSRLRDSDFSKHAKSSLNPQDDYISSKQTGGSLLSKMYDTPERVRREKEKIKKDSEDDHSFHTESQIHTNQPKSPEDDYVISKETGANLIFQDLNSTPPSQSKLKDLESPKLSKSNSPQRSQILTQEESPKVTGKSELDQSLEKKTLANVSRIEITPTNPNQFKYCFKKMNLLLTIERANLLNQDVDIIVNPSDFKTIGGICKAIKLYSECSFHRVQQYLTGKNVKSLPMHDILQTETENIYPNLILHSCPPDWNKYSKPNKRQCYYDLKFFYTNILFHLDYFMPNVKSLGLSLVDCGIPKEISSKALFHAIEDYLIDSEESMRNLRFIRIVNTCQEANRILVDFFTHKISRYYTIESEAEENAQKNKTTVEKKC